MSDSDTARPQLQLPRPGLLSEDVTRETFCHLSLPCCKNPELITHGKLIEMRSNAVMHKNNVHDKQNVLWLLFLGRVCFVKVW